MLRSVTPYFLLLLFYTFTLVVSPFSVAKINHVVLEQVSVEEGLTQASIYAQMQDQQGFMWFGTESGIDVYDGHSVRQLLGPNDRFSSFSANRIYQTHDGLIWFSFWTNGVYTFDPKTNQYEFIGKQDPFSQEYYYNDLLEYDSNSIWMVTDKSIVLYHRDSKTFSTHIDLSEYLNIRNGYIHRVRLFQNKLFIGTQAGTFVYSIEQDNLLAMPSPGQRHFDNIKVDEKELIKAYEFMVIDDLLMIGTNDGVLGVDLASIAGLLNGEEIELNYQMLAPKVSVWQMVRDNKLIYIAAEDGLHEFNLESQRTRHLFEYSDFDKTVSDSSLMNLTLDQNGHLWMGSSTAGVFKWNPASTQILNFYYQKGHKESLLASSVNAVIQSHFIEKEVYVGTENGLNIIDVSTDKVTSYLHSKDNKDGDQNGIYWLDEDALNRLWLNTDEGLQLFDLARRELITPDYLTNILGPEKNYVSGIHLHGNYLWMSTEAGLSYVDVTDGKKTIVNLPDVMSERPFETYIFAAEIKGQTTLLISNHNSLWQFDYESASFSLIYQIKDVGQAGYTFIESAIADRGVLWLAYSGIGVVGLSIDDFSVVDELNFENSGINPDVYGIKVDIEGNVWFSSHAGIYRYQPKERHIRQFTMSDGLVGTEYNAGSYTTLSDGRFLYGGVAGISIFDPTILATNKVQKRNEVQITGVSSLSSNIDAPLFIEGGQTIDLAYNDVGIRIDFSALSYSSTDKPLYEYRFVDGITYPESKFSFMMLPQLKSGKHIFEVRAKSGVTGEYSAPKRIVLNVSYAPWRSPAAILSYLIIALSIILYWLRSRHIRQQELLRAHEQVKYRENRLQLALRGSNSEVWDWKARTNQIFGKRLADDLGHAEVALNHSFEEFVDLIHPEDRGNFQSRWQQFIDLADVEKSFECSYRLQCADGKWLWYKDLGKIVAVNKVGKPTRVTGSYTNITESKANLERAQYYGAAFEQTKDWVLIVDVDFSKVRANRSMAEVFDWEQEELNFSQNLLGFDEQRIRYYKRLVPKIIEEGFWRGEEILHTPAGEKYHVIVNISVSQSDNLEQKHLICVFTDITAQKAAEKELRYMANYDHLTGLPNRTLLVDRIQHGIDFSNRQNESIALFFIDLDRFKQVNDSLGHEYGDLLLKEVTSRLTGSLRSDDTIARIGGDEFVVLLESYRNNNELGHISQKLIETLGEPITLNQNVVSIGASIGISMYPDDSSNSEELLRHADVAMYHAKQSGRNNFQFFTEHMNKEAKLRLKRESNLKMAVSNDEFFNLYQPIMDAHDGKAIGAELLLRWQHQDQVISPVDFIPLSEELGLIVSMTAAAMEKGFIELKQWRKKRPDFYLSVNFSAAHFLQEDLEKWIVEILEVHGLPANALKIEVTESAFISDPERAIETMQALSNLGVRLSLDDFGTGFSSLSYLKKLPLDIIKIDRSFVSGIGIEKTDEAIVEATLVLAKSLNMFCVAEGVETLEQLQYLVDRDCHHIQGFLYYKPLLAEELSTAIAKCDQEITAISNN